MERTHRVMNWRKPIYSTILRMKGSVMKYLAEYEKTQWYSLEQIKEYQRKELEKLLRHASQHVPYYRKIMQEYGVMRNDDIIIDRFTNLPFLTKSIIRQHFEELKSDDLEQRDWHKNSSGGSTGEPVTFIQDKEYQDKGIAQMLLGDKMVGKELCEPEIKLWGSERDLFQGTIGLRAKVSNFIRNQRLLNSFKMSQEDMKNYISQINSLRPKLVLAYAQSAYELAHFSLKQSLPIKPVGAVMTSAGTLYPFMWETISEAFHAPVFNRYGSREVGNIATECDAHLGLHVNMETQFVEIIDEQGNPCPPGQEGEIVITLLTNYAMPLIRYRIGDMGVWANQECICGRGATLLKTVTGRTVDIFLTKAGEKVDGEYFTHLIYFKNWVQKFQFIQEEVELIRVKIQVNGEPPTNELKEIEEKIRLVMGQSCKVEFEFVEDILPHSSGKYRYTISKVYDMR